MDDLEAQLEQWYKEGKIEEAYKYLEVVVRQEPASALVHLHYGYMLDGKSREGGAIRHYQKALNLGLSKAQRACCLVCLASSYRNRKRQVEALSTIEMAFHEFPDEISVMMFYALILADLDRGDEGLAILGSACLEKLDPASFMGFRTVLGSRYRGLARRAKARKSTKG